VGLEAKRRWGPPASRSPVRDKVAKTAEMYSWGGPDCVLLLRSVAESGDGLDEFEGNYVDCGYEGFVAATGWASSSLNCWGQ
jgi:hypothetical protein